MSETSTINNQYNNMAKQILGIDIHNDGKGKYQSVEAKLDIDGSFDIMFHNNEMNLVGYGYTETEAIENLNKCLEKIKENLNSVNISDCDNITHVDCLGEPISEKKQ